MLDVILGSTALKQANGVTVPLMENYSLFAFQWSKQIKMKIFASYKELIFT